MSPRRAPKGRARTATGARRGRTKAAHRAPFWDKRRSGGARWQEARRLRARRRAGTRYARAPHAVVGSIRLAAEGAPDTVEGFFDPEGGLTPYAVSYTHLTLPTICSV
eukprot:2730114-Rhodomonas_salina.1